MDKKIYACGNTGICYSSDGGTTSFNIATDIFFTISLSGNENTLLAGTSSISGGKIYFWSNISNTSTYSIYNTSSSSSLPTNPEWRGSACSYDGTILIMGDITTSSGGVYISNNAGASWTQQNEINNLQNLTLSCSQKADYIIAGGPNTQLYLGR